MRNITHAKFQNPLTHSRYNFSSSLNTTQYSQLLRNHSLKFSRHNFFTSNISNDNQNTKTQIRCISNLSTKKSLNSNRVDRNNNFSNLNRFSKRFSSNSSMFNNEKQLSNENINNRYLYLLLLAMFASIMAFSSIQADAEENEQQENEEETKDKKKPDPTELNRESVEKLQQLRGTKLDDHRVFLYQYGACPFCSKVRAFLDYHRVPYEIVEVDPVFKTELKQDSPDYKKVPIVYVNDIRLVDSSHIITHLNDVFYNSQYQLPNGGRSNEEEHWRHWVDNRLVHTLPPNIYRTPSEAFQAFDNISSKNDFSFFQRAVAKYAGSTAMYAVSKRLKKRHGIEDEREALYDCAREWLNALGSRKFMGGNEPNLADLAVYGAFNAIEGLDCFNDLTKETDIEGWYYRVRNSIGTSVKIRVNNK